MVVAASQNRRFAVKDHEQRVDNDHQKTVSGQKQHGPAERVGKDAGGNQGSKGQNLGQNARGTDKEPGDLGDERSGSGSGGSQGNRQNKSVNRAETPH
jgi:hypothetical protein